MNKEYNVASSQELPILIKKIEDSLPNFKLTIPHSKNYFTNTGKSFNNNENTLNNITNNIGDIKIIPVKNPNTNTVFATFVGNHGIIVIQTTSNVITHTDKIGYSTDNNKFMRQRISNSDIFDTLKPYTSKNMLKAVYGEWYNK